MLLVLALVVSAAGFGAVQFSPTQSGPDQAAMPSPPTVAPPDGTAAPTTTPSDSPTTGPKGTTTSPAGNPGTASIAIEVENPDDVQSLSGDVDLLEGRLTGTIDWNVSKASSLTVVVSTWSPDHGWTTTHNVSRNVTDVGNVTLEEVVENPIVYASGDRADDFDNPRGGTTVVREGYVTVTTFVSTGDRVVERESMKEFTFAVTNLESATSSSTSNPALSVSEPALFAVDNAAPGQSGTSETIVTNTGNAPGDLNLVLKDVVSAENGLIEPERDTDRPGNGGELAAALDVRITLVREDGSRRYAVGGPNSFVSADSLEPSVLAANYHLAAGNSVRVVTEWRIPSSTGNEIQTDVVSVNASYVLTST